MVSEEKMFENVDGRTTDGRRTDDGRTTDAGVTGILIAHLGAFGSGELKKSQINYSVAILQTISKLLMETKSVTPPKTWSLFVYHAWQATQQKQLCPNSECQNCLWQKKTIHSTSDTKWHNIQAHSSFTHTRFDIAWNCKQRNKLESNSSYYLTTLIIVHT